MLEASHSWQVNMAWPPQKPVSGSARLTAVYQRAKLEVADLLVLKASCLLDATGVTAPGGGPRHLDDALTLEALHHAHEALRVAAAFIFIANVCFFFLGVGFLAGR
jgi:hypothetical protein